MYLDFTLLALRPWPLHGRFPPSSSTQNPKLHDLVYHRFCLNLIFRLSCKSSVGIHTGSTTVLFQEISHMLLVSASTRQLRAQPALGTQGGSLSSRPYADFQTRGYCAWMPAVTEADTCTEFTGSMLCCGLLQTSWMARSITGWPRADDLCLKPCWTWPSDGWTGRFRNRHAKSLVTYTLGLENGMAMDAFARSYSIPHSLDLPPRPTEHPGCADRDLDGAFAVRVYGGQVRGFSIVILHQLAG